MSNLSFEEWVQSRLTSHGFPCGLIDGIIGPITFAALKAFQEHYGLAQSGVTDEATVKALRASASALTPSDMVQIPDRDETRPEATSKAVRNNWPRQSGVPTFYGPVGTSQTKVEIPFDMYLAWDTSTRIRAMTLHKKVADSASRVLHEIRDTYSNKERTNLGIHLFGGSLNVRKMRGGSSYSMHSWGIAIDFDPIRNQLKWHAPKARLSHADALPFWQAWENEGWLSLGRARDFDWMHVQAARL
jgi:peptidoglycan hydrolase-like protein with peptidoglycan-binding domain